MINWNCTPRAHQWEGYLAHRETLNWGHWWDQGCVDRDTEYLSPTGWRRIVDYDGGLAAQWHPESGEAEFVQPMEFVNLPCANFLHLSGVRTTNQMLSAEHHVPIMNKRATRVIDTISADEMACRLEDGKVVRLPCSFTLNPSGRGIDLSDRDLRLQVAVMADGHFGSSTTRCAVNLKKSRKIERLRHLLGGRDDVSIRVCDDGYTRFRFYAPVRAKQWPDSWWQMTTVQRDMLLDEVVHWDGTVKSSGWGFYSKHESDVDIVQFIAASAGNVTTKTFESGVWALSVRGIRTNCFAVRRENLSVVPSTDGRKYCFMMPSGYWVARRGGKTFPTGNTGKTAEVLAQASHLYRTGKINAILVLAPAGVEANWVRTEIPKHLPDDIAQLGESFWWSSKKSTTKKYAASYADFLTTPGLKILCMSYNAMMTDRGAKAARKFLDDHDVLYVLDESTAIKTPDAKTTKRVVASGKHAKYRRCLNGTPVEDSPFALYTQVKFLDPNVWTSRGINTYTQFKAMFGIFMTMVLGNGKSFPQLKSYRNLALLKECMYEAGDRVLKEDCLDLPPKNYTKVYFDMTPKQWRLTNELKQHYTAQSASGEAIDAELAIVRLTRYQQIASGYFPKGEDEELELIDPKNPRIIALDTALDNCPGQVIIFAKYLMDIEAIAEMLERRNTSFVKYIGSTGEDERERAKEAFQDNLVDVFLANKSAAKGLTLTAASTVIFYNNLFSADIRKQQEDRAHRIGQEKSVRYIDIIAADSVDEHILATLRRKKDVASIVTGDTIGEWI